MRGRRGRRRAFRTHIRVGDIPSQRVRHKPLKALRIRAQNGPTPQLGVSPAHNMISTTQKVARDLLHAPPAPVGKQAQFCKPAGAAPVLKLKLQAPNQVPTPKLLLYSPVEARSVIYKPSDPANWKQFAKNPARPGVFWKKRYPHFLKFTPGPRRIFT